MIVEERIYTLQPGQAGGVVQNVPFPGNTGNR